MRFRFWGVRGSLPCPLSPGALRAKISAILHRAAPSDLASPETRELFLSRLPEELFGHVGGNTTCFEIEADPNEILVVDGGTGIRELGLVREGKVPGGRHYHIFLSHFHWDHLQGLPFFAGLTHPGNRITLYSPVQGFEEHVRDQMRHPFFPVPMSVFPAQVAFVELTGASLSVGGTLVRWKEVNHPDLCYCYRFDRQGQSLVFSTDTELRLQDFGGGEPNQSFYGGIDVLILDAQYTLDEAVHRLDWGHTAASHAVDFALDFAIPTLYLFHHEPDHDDAKIEEIGRVAQWYSDLKRPDALKVLVAREGQDEEIR